jgi:(2Fe-2S) ferredoxin
VSRSERLLRRRDRSWGEVRKGGVGPLREGMGQYERHVFVCTTGSTCPTQGDTEAYVKYLRGEVARAGLHVEIRINKSGCFSQCGNGPMIVVYPENVWYSGVTADDLAAIVESHLLGGKPVERLLYRPGKPGPNVIAKEKK